MPGQDWHLFWQRPFFHQLVSTQNESKFIFHRQVQVSVHPTWRERQLQLPHKHPLHQARLRLRAGEVADSDPEWGLGMLPAADEGTVLWVGGGVWWFSQHPAGSFRYISLKTTIICFCIRSTTVKSFSIALNGWTPPKRQDMKIGFWIETLCFKLTGFFSEEAIRKVQLLVGQGGPCHHQDDERVHEGQHCFQVLVGFSSVSYSCFIDICRYLTAATTCPELHITDYGLSKVSIFATNRLPRIH